MGVAGINKRVLRSPAPLGFAKRRRPNDKSPIRITARSNGEPLLVVHGHASTNQTVYPFGDCVLAEDESAECVGSPEACIPRDLFGILEHGDEHEACPLSRDLFAELEHEGPRCSSVVGSISESAGQQHVNGRGESFWDELEEGSCLPPRILNKIVEVRGDLSHLRSSPKKRRRGICFEVQFAPPAPRFLLSPLRAGAGKLLPCLPYPCVLLMIKLRRSLLSMTLYNIMILHNTLILPPLRL